MRPELDAWRSAAGTQGSQHHAGRNHGLTAAARDGSGAVAAPPPARGARGAPAVVADGSRLFAEALAIVLGRRGIRVLATTVSAEEMLALVARCQPKLVVVGLPLQGEAPSPLAAALRQRAPAARLLVLLNRVGLPGGAIDDAGLDGVVGKDIGSDGVAAVAVEVARGGRVHQRVAVPAASSTVSRRHEDLLLSQLTPRELQILELLADGTSSEGIARGLGIKPNTARTHVQNILTKLNVNSRLEAVSLAVREGLVHASRRGPASA